ncbi:50S ribosomal protein L23 [Myxococcota bacterium]
MQPEEIIIQPILTEKGTGLQEQHNQVLFKVHMSANKTQIRQAVEKLFDVKVFGVRTQVVRGKPVRRGRFEGKRSNWKKAIVSLAEGESIEFFQGI